MTFTCSICYRDTFAGTWGLCTDHLKEFSITGTYQEVTPTGTFSLPEWIRKFSAEHHADEMKMYHYREIPFTDWLEEPDDRP